jgi:hypothetical protein
MCARSRIEHHRIKSRSSVADCTTAYGPAWQNIVSVAVREEDARALRTRSRQRWLANLPGPSAIAGAVGDRRCPGDGRRDERLSRMLAVRAWEHVRIKERSKTSCGKCSMSGAVRHATWRVARRVVVGITLKPEHRSPKALETTAA